MTDESKTETQPTTELKSSETKVEITQEKLDSLISEKYKKGAEKANAKLLEELGVESVDSIKELLKAKREADEAAKTELEKAQEAIEAIKAEKEELANKTKKLEQSNHISKLASEHKVKDLDYFEFKYTQAKKSDDFNEDTFIESFTKANPSAPPPTDNSSNNRQTPGGKDLKSMTIAELKKYQATL